MLILTMEVPRTSFEMTYKQYHEEYMSNNNGTTASEVFLAIAVVTPIALLQIMLVFLSPMLVNNYYLNGKIFLFEYCFIVIPTIAAVTVLSTYLLHLLIATLLCCAVVLLLLYSNQKPSSKGFNKSYYMKKRLCVTYVRAATNIVTAVCILAVDFKIFPRRFSKTERLGFSVMDIGVGLYVAINAVVAPEARAKASYLTLRHTCMNSIPLFILGTARLLATRMLNYQQHISEYGVHWNFFFTLGFTKILSSVLLSALPHLKWKLYLLISLSLIVCYELCLNLGLKNWILSDVARTDFLSSNREGIFSVIGYLAIYFSGLALGQLFFKTKSVTLKKNLKLLASLLCAGCVGWMCTLWVDKYLGVSRRLANMGYFTWVITFVISIFCLALLGEICVLFLSISFKDTKQKFICVPLLFEVCNCNGLLFFLLANVLTGLVNLSMKTLYVPPMQSFVILSLYMVICCGITSLYHVKKNCKKL